MTLMVVDLVQQRAAASRGQFDGGQHEGVHPAGFGSSKSG